MWAQLPQQQICQPELLQQSINQYQHYLDLVSQNEPARPAHQNPRQQAKAEGLTAPAVPGVLNTLKDEPAVEPNLLQKKTQQKQGNPLVAFLSSDAPPALTNQDAERTGPVHSLIFTQSDVDTSKEQTEITETQGTNQSSDTQNDVLTEAL